MDKIKFFIHKNIRLVLFSLGSIFSIFFIALYILKYVNEEQLIFGAIEQLYTCLFLLYVIICLIIGIFIAFMLNKVSKQNTELKQQNNDLKDRLENISNLIIQLCDKTFSSESNLSYKIETIETVLSEKIDIAEDEILRSNRENESTMLNLFKVR